MQSNGPLPQVLFGMVEMCKLTISEPLVYRVYICSECNNISFGMFDMCKLTFSEPLAYRVYVLIAMCKLMIPEPLVYRLYVWCAITFYLACLRCANRLFLTQGCKLHSPIQPDKVLILRMDS